MKKNFTINKTFDLELEEKRIGRKYRKKIFKKIAHLTFLEKKHVLRLADEEFINGLIDLDQPRKKSSFLPKDIFSLTFASTHRNGKSYATTALLRA